jgi:hypothetical protein
MAFSSEKMKFNYLSYLELAQGPAHNGYNLDNITDAWLRPSTLQIPASQT